MMSQRFHWRDLIALYKILQVLIVFLRETHVTVENFAELF